MVRYELTELAPITCNSIIYIVGKNYYKVIYGCLSEISWKDLIKDAVTNKKEKYGSCLIIIEEPLNGKVFQFGNHDRKHVYEHGDVLGYA